MRDYFHRESRYIDLAFNIPITIRAFVPTTTCTKDSVRVTLTLCYLMLLHSEPVQSCNNHVNKASWVPAKQQYVRTFRSC